MKIRGLGAGAAKTGDRGGDEEEVNFFSETLSPWQSHEVETMAVLIRKATETITRSNNTINQRFRTKTVAKPGEDDACFAISTTTNAVTSNAFRV